MSMPQYIEIAVTGSDADELKRMTDDTIVYMTGIAPRYKLVALNGGPIPGGTSLPELDAFRVLFWIALDDDSRAVCEKLDAANKERKDYTRGFYQELLPRRIVQVSGKDEFVKVLEGVLHAFGMSS